MADAPFLSRQARFASVGSTNDVVRSWLEAGVPEVCLAVADEQTAGRGRVGRTWQAPAGAALLLSLGFRPSWLPPERSWRLPATVSLAMADAAEEVAGLPDGAIRLKWPNDLVVEADGAADIAAEDSSDEGAPSPSTARGPGAPQHPALLASLATPPGVRKLAGVLGESDGLGSDDPRMVVGIGVNAGWPAATFPAELAATMTSLHEASRGRPVDLALLLDGFLGRLEVRIAALRAGRFDLADWNARQVTTGREVDVEGPDGGVERLRAIGVDAASGGLVVEGERILLVGDIRHVRVGAATAHAPAGTGV